MASTSLWRSDLTHSSISGYEFECSRPWVALDSEMGQTYEAFQSAKQEPVAGPLHPSGQKDNYPARSVYKLQEIQKKLPYSQKGGRVLDLGCAPGSWLLFAARLIGPDGSGGGDRPQAGHHRAAGQRKRDHRRHRRSRRSFLAASGRLRRGDQRHGAGDHRSQGVSTRCGPWCLCEAALAVAAKTLVPGGNLSVKFSKGRISRLF